MKHERRTVPVAEVRMPDESGKTFEAVVLRYNVIDDYDTRFRPGVFTESLSARLPRICWAHRWDEPLGRYVDFRDTDTELTLIGEFDDFDAVARAKQASAQLRSGTIDQFSVGFMRLASEDVDPSAVAGQRGVVDITKGQLDEVSLVLVGAVPGTKLLAVRSTGGMIDTDTLVEIAKRKAAGELSEAEAQAALDLIATPGEPLTPADDPEIEDDTDDVLAEAAEVLDALEG